MIGALCARNDDCDVGKGFSTALDFLLPAMSANDAMDGILFMKLILTIQDYKDGRIRQEAVGCMAEVVEALGEAVAPKLDVWCALT